jgi:AcrR family transcriptional regulator
MSSVPDDGLDERPALSKLHQTVRDRFTASGRLDEGLRERKKRLMRQQISDTATIMFLDRDFDEVRVSEVAAACGVSEKTVYNYFPTKESLLLDREDDMAAKLRRALGPGTARISPVDAIVGVLDEEAVQLNSSWEAGGPQDVSGIRRFSDLIERTPSLRTAQIDMMERLAQVAAEAMADRAGVNPDDPEPQIAADALLGLWRIYFRAIHRYADGAHRPQQIRDEVIAEVRRAARLIDTGLWSFGIVVQGTKGRQQLKLAADASNEARKQVMVAIKQARDAWRLMKAEAHEHAHDERQDLRRDRGAQRDAERAVQQTRRGAQRPVRRR